MDALNQLNVLLHDGDLFAMDGTQIRVLKQSYEIGFAGQLESHHCTGMDPQVSLRILGNLKKTRCWNGSLQMEAQWTSGSDRSP